MIIILAFLLLGFIVYSACTDNTDYKIQMFALISLFILQFLTLFFIFLLFLTNNSFWAWIL